LGLEHFLSSLLNMPLWRHSHELTTFFGLDVSKPFEQNVEGTDGNSSASEGECDQELLLSRIGSCGMTPSRAPPWSPSADNKTPTELFSQSHVRRTSIELVSAPFIAAVELVAPSLRKTDKPAATSRTCQPSVADWRKLRRVEHRCYVLLCSLFEVERLGMVRRNFLSLIRRVTTTLWSPSVATWLGDQAKRDHKVKLLTFLVEKLNCLLWQDLKPGVVSLHAPNIQMQDFAGTIVTLRTDLASLVPVSLASLLGQKATDDAVDKLLELLLCPVQLRSLTLTLLDLVFVEIFPELELAVIGLDHLV